MPATAESPATLRVDGDTLALAGDLDFSTVGDVLDAGRAAIAGATSARLVVDLGAVAKSDSAGVALLLDWLRSARARDLDVVVRDVPAQFAEIARLGGLESILGLTDDDDAA